VSGNFFTNQCIIFLFSTSLSGYALPNVPRTAAKYFDANKCSTTKERYSRKYTMFVPPQVLRN